MESLLVPVYAVTRIIPLQDLIQSQRLNITALQQQRFGSRQLLLLGSCGQIAIRLQLHEDSLSGACVEDVGYAGLQEEVQGQRVMPAVMEDLQYFLIDHYITDQFLGQRNGLVLSLLLHSEDVDQESVGLIVQLHHLHKTATTQPALQVHAQDLTPKDKRAEFEQRLQTVDIYGVALLHCLSLCVEKLHLVLGELIPKLAGAVAEHLCGEIVGEFGVVDELEGGEVQEVVALDDEQRLYLVQHVSVVYLELPRQLLVELGPPHQTRWPFLVQVRAGSPQHLLGLGLQAHLLRQRLETPPVEHFQEVSERETLLLEHDGEGRNSEVRDGRKEEFLLDGGLVQRAFCLCGDSLVFPAVHLDRFFLRSPPEEESGLPFEAGRHHEALPEVPAALGVAEVGSEVGELDASHQFVEARTGVLADQHFLREIGPGVVTLEEFDEVVEELPVHFRTNLRPERAVAVELLEGVLLGGLELVEVDIDPGTLDCLLLAEGSVLQVVLFHCLPRPRVVLQVIDPVAEMTIFLLEHAQTAHVEPAQRSLRQLLLRLGDVLHLKCYYKTYSLISLNTNFALIKEYKKTSMAGRNFNEKQCRQSIKAFLLQKANQLPCLLQINKKFRVNFPGLSVSVKKAINYFLIFYKAPKNLLFPGGWGGDVSREVPAIGELELFEQLAATLCKKGLRQPLPDLPPRMTAHRAVEDFPAGLPSVEDNEWLVDNRLV